MAYLPPIPQDKIGECHPWRDWFEKLSSAVASLSGSGGSGGSTTTNVVPALLFDDGGSGEDLSLVPPSFASPGGVGSPFYGAFESTATQTVPAINTATLMTLNQTDVSSGVALGTPTSRIVVGATGVYNIQWSGQFQNTDTSLHDVNVWVRINGVDVAGTNGISSIPNSHGGTPGHTIAAWNYFFQLSANSYVELVWSTDSTAVTLQAYAAATPAPSTASLIITLNKVS